MRICFRHISLLVLTLSLVACAAIPMSNTTPATNLSAPSASASGHFLFQKLSIRPRANSPATLINFVSDGPAQRGVPCISCVGGAASKDNIGLTGPSSYIPASSVWQYSLSFTDIAYKGKCKLDWTITSGNTNLDSFSVTLNLTTAGGYVLYALNRKRPNYSGPATLTGKYTCGKESASAHAPLEFE